MDEVHVNKGDERSAARGKVVAKAAKGPGMAAAKKEARAALKGAPTPHVKHCKHCQVPRGLTDHFRKLAATASCCAPGALPRHHRDPDSFFVSFFKHFDLSANIMKRAKKKKR